MNMSTALTFEMRYNIPEYIKKSEKRRLEIPEKFTQMCWTWMHVNVY